MNGMPSAELYRQQMGSRQNQSQAIDYSLYDTLTYTDNTTTQLEFFRTVKANRLLSNMELAGALPHPFAFHIYAIRIVPFVAPSLLADQATPANDAYLLLANSYCELYIAHKRYGTWHSLLLPAGAGIWGNISGAGGEATNEFVSMASHGTPDPNAIYKFMHPIQIDPQISFNFNMNWPTAVDTSGNINIMVVFSGRLIRPVQ